MVGGRASRRVAECIATRIARDGLLPADVIVVVAVVMLLLRRKPRAEEG